MARRDGSCSLIDAAIDLDMVAQATPLTLGEGSGDFRHGLLLHECLPAKSRADGHDEEEIDLIKVGEDLIEGRVRIQGQSAAAARFADAGQGAADVMIGFDVDGDVFGSCLDETGKIVVRIRDHEVNVEEQFRAGTHDGHELRSKGNVVDEMPIHDIEMKPVPAAGFGTTAFLRDPAPVGGEHGGCNDALLAVVRHGLSTISGPEALCKENSRFALRPGKGENSSIEKPVGWEQGVVPALSTLPWSQTPTFPQPAPPGFQNR